jgi:DNA topoisomerase-1
MAKSLVIVESPSKAKTINKYLGTGYKVLASVGHVKDLPKKDIGIDFDADFEPSYITIPGKEKVIKAIATAAKDADHIYVATDPDREGEAIGWHIKEEILAGAGKKKQTVQRILFNEITKPAILEAMKHPGEIDDRLVNAQQARRLLDRIVGYQVSPLLWDKVRRGLSAGRVQTVAVRLVVEREREIEAFVTTEYWSVVANLSAKLPPAFDAKLYKVSDQTVKLGSFDKDVRKGEIHITSAEQAKSITDELNAATYTVADLTKKEKKRNPVPAFVTSKLQQEAARKLRFNVKRTMRIAQQLYEGVDIGAEGTVGLITYMRTDSTRVADSALGEARDYIGRTFGTNYLPEKAVVYRSKKGAQDAHEAIRPTGVERTPDAMAPFLTPEQLTLYKLIWQRFVASQMMPALFDQTTIDIVAAEKYLFRATGSVLKFDGFLAVYEEGKDEKDDEDDERKLSLPMTSKGETLTLNELHPNQHFTEPPPRYSEATLVKALEENGIGRPSTYASIMTVIQDREYVEKQGDRFHPTELGVIVNDLLIASFDDIFNAEYTAALEAQLDDIEEGRAEWRTTLRSFYDKFTVDLAQARKDMKDVKRQEILTDEKCDKCGSVMAIKFGKFGRFLACTNYPECKNTRDLAKAPATESADGSAVAAPENPFEGEMCEKCGKPLALKRGRFGQFLACTGYPECRNTRKISKAGVVAQPDRPLEELCPECGKHLVAKQGRFGEFTSCSDYPTCKYIKRDTIGLPCPVCQKGDIAVKRSKRGKTFYGCTRYPECEFTVWDKPIDKPCPSCGATFLVEKTSSKGVVSNACANKECSYKEAAGDGGDVAGAEVVAKAKAPRKKATPAAK